MSTVFSSLHESLQQVLAHRLGWNDIRDVQEQAFQAVAAGKDVLVVAPTAGGKSEAALIPVMDDILKNGRSGVSCLYISPLKALINDQEERFRSFCTPTSLSVMMWHGDVPKGDRSWHEGEPPHFLMITPESLEVVLQEKEIAGDLRKVRYIIVDELHAFVETERGVHLKVLLERMDRIAHRKIQRIGLSATTGNPEEVLTWLSDCRYGTELVAVPAPPQEKHFLFVVEPDEEKRMESLIENAAGKKALVFVNSRSRAEKIVNACGGRIRNLHIHHSSLAPSLRQTAEKAFNSEESACIICTSTLELGIDIGDLDVVIQVDPPQSVSSFLQRMGRSGRRGKAAFMAWLLSSPCDLLCSIAIIECAAEKSTENLVPPKKPYNVLLQQVFLHLHAHPRSTLRDLAMQLLSSPAFAGIDRQTFDRILSHLIVTGYLAADGEMVMLGPETEKAFGRSNWKDLYSVIAGSEGYRAVTPDGEVVGKLDARFVNSRTSGDLSLGGKDWSMVKCDEGHNMVVVVPRAGIAGLPSKIFWLGTGEPGYSPLIARKVRQIIARGGSVLPLGEREKEILDTFLRRIPVRAGLPGMPAIEGTGKTGKDTTVFSFHGRSVNAILALVLRHRFGRNITVAADDFRVVISWRRGANVAGCLDPFLEGIASMSRDKLASLLPLPKPETWKFARALPDQVVREMAVSDYYKLDAFIHELANP